MTHSLQPQADLVREAVRSLERALAATRVQWDDAARRAFDQRHADPVVSAARSTTDELAGLAQDLAAALKSLQ